MHASSLNESSLNSIVESHYAGLEALLSAVHADDPKREILVRIGDAMREAKLAATIISDLQAALYLEKNKSDNLEQNYEELHSRIKSETAEALTAIEAKCSPDRVTVTSENIWRSWDGLNQIVVEVRGLARAAIRSLGSTGGSDSPKPAEASNG